MEFVGKERTLLTLVQSLSYFVSGKRELQPEKLREGKGRPFPCIPINYHNMLEWLEEAKKLCGTDRPKILDVGCGLNVVVRLAVDLLGYSRESFGIDFNPEYNSEIWASHHNQDARKFKDYGKFDVIYCYYILSEPADMRNLLRTMIKQTKPGTLFVLPLFSTYCYSYRNSRECLIKGLSRVDRSDPNDFPIFVREAA